MERLGRILARLALPGPGPLEQSRILDTVHQVFGPELAEEVRIGSLRGGRLTLEVRSAARAFEWETFRKGELLLALARQDDLGRFKDVRFRVGSWR